MNASEKNKKRNKNYKIRPKENEGEKKKRKKDVRYVVWNSMTAFHKNYATGVGFRKRNRKSVGFRSGFHLRNPSCGMCHPGWVVPTQSPNIWLI